MFGWLKRGQQRQYAVSEGLRVYAIGDVHGRLDLLDDLLCHIEADAQQQPAAHTRIILLGDYIDRGPQSAQVLDRVIAGGPGWITLRGNHEQAMLDALDGGGDSSRTLRLWLENGGRETLRSYGMSPSLAYSDDLAAILDAAAALVPEHHLVALRTMPLFHRDGDYLFVHAGIRPGLSLDEQQESDLLWIREAFLDCRSDHGFVVVHGHSISRTVDERPNRIGIDTGAYATGRLTALVLEGADRRYLST